MFVESVISKVLSDAKPIRPKLAHRFSPKVSPEEKYQREIKVSSKHQIFEVLWCIDGHHKPEIKAQITQVKEEQ